MSLEITIHAAQTGILRELLFHPHADYTALQKPTGLTSDHFNFHISRLLELGLVEKMSRGTYRLSAKGKEYANRLDTDNNTVERQPKSAVMLALTRTRAGKTEFLYQERLKNPFYGFWGLPTGKIRWGETIIQTAERESLEETGLKGDFTVLGVCHEHVMQTESGELLEDKIFFIVMGRNMKGKLLADFQGGRNQWMTLDEFIAKEKRFDNYIEPLAIINGQKWFAEQTTSYSRNVF